MDPPPDFLFDGAHPLVKNEVREVLLEMNLPNLAIQSAIFIDHKNVWHENYWFLTFLERFDCWDRKLSRYDPEPMPTSGHFFVDTYALDDALLKKTPLQQRLLFKLGKTSDGLVIVHESLAHLFRGTGIALVPIADYEE